MSKPVCAGAEKFDVIASTVQESGERAAANAPGRAVVHNFVCASARGSRGVRGMSGPVGTRTEKRNGHSKHSAGKLRKSSHRALRSAAVHKYVCAQMGPGSCGSQIVSKLMVF